MTVGYPLPLYEELKRADLPKRVGAALSYRDLSNIKYFVPHHTGNELKDFNAHARYHVSKGWTTLGYHLFYQDGEVQVSRELSTIGAHTRGINEVSIGACIAGNFDQRKPSDDEYWMWIQMQLICEFYLGRRLETKMHCQYVATTCPGKNFSLEYYLKHLNDFRNLLSL
jgi:N-acetylmuramoyl-L-alanine amidase